MNAPKRINRRQWLCASVAAISPALFAHTPYNQWVVYRKKHLLIGASKDNTSSYPLAKDLVAMLDAWLPAARSRVARAPTVQRLASLLTTDQLPLALLDTEQASLLRTGHSPFEDFGPVDLRVVISTGQYLLISARSFPDDHAWQVTKALVQATPQYRELTLAADSAPIHDGSKAFLDGGKRHE